MSQQFINVHTFDGKLKGIFTPVGRYTANEKKEQFTVLISHLHNPIAIATVQTIIHDLTQDHGSNFQAENNVNASDILMELIQWIGNTDILKDLDEQLADVRNLGICPSGRVTRLLQLWSAYVNAEKEKKECEKKC